MYITRTAHDFALLDNTAYIYESIRATIDNKIDLPRDFFFFGYTSDEIETFP